MESTISAKTWKAIYRLLDRVCPVPYDCGTLCGAICCCTDSENVGIYLFPGEHQIHDRNADWLEWETDKASDYNFPDSWDGEVYFVNCKNPPHCPRKMRPLQCRTFPLVPYIDEDGILSLIWDFDELPYRCPLLEEKPEIDERFYRATYTAWSHLVRDPLIYDLVEMDSRRFDREQEEKDSEESGGEQKEMK